ncbi:helix-turn-helix domain-containing protein [Petroclostridium sp. X23]|uniref:helix-turn-helix domain-containing protein n=1 Tax=Petroclostridium sp. X23 TaxID=3045146 RepID=UPI0024AD6E67|nr:helix-turn-helix domain-containing protein [Petroclostridium sp. X23]WHH58444.1 helix-turn-helix domain-containing protein [Petroclostridium sp. X23]
MKLGEKIKKIRKEKNLTLKDISNLVGISISYLSDVENNRKNPSVESLTKISTALNIPTSVLLDESDIVYKEDFLNQAKEKYGNRGKKQAEQLLEDTRALFHGGDLPAEDRDEFFKAIMEIYFQTKEENKKYGRKKNNAE